MPCRLKDVFSLKAIARSAVIEAVGAAAEFTAMVLTRPALTQGALKKGQHGNGRPVLLVPGLGSGEWHMEPMKQFLEGMGYKVYHWGQGTNTGLKPHTKEKLEERLAEIHQIHGGEKVGLIGESIGGLMTQELERRHPEMVRCLISLGTPRTDIHKPGHITPLARAAYAVMNPWSWQCLIDPAIARRFGTPPDNGVPKTVIIGRFDQIADIRSTRMPETSAKIENIEVFSTHVGMACNPLVHAIVADRLAQDPDNWKKLDVHGLKSFLIKILPRHVLPENPGWNGCPKSPLPFQKTSEVQTSFVETVFSAGKRALASVG